MTTALHEILYLDDEVINLEIFKLTFRNNFNITTALSATEALDLVSKNRFPIIITDYKMPLMNGVEFIEEVKKISPESLCIMVTGFIDEINIKNKEHFLGIVNKPWRKDELMNMINNAILQYEQESN